MGLMVAVPCFALAAFILLCISPLFFFIALLIALLVLGVKALSAWDTRETRSADQRVMARRRALGYDA